MNCKQGDRAIIVRGLRLNVGRLVRVIEPAPDVPHGDKYRVGTTVWLHDGTAGPLWVCESLSGYFTTKNGKKRTVRPIPDAYLMPLPPESECLDDIISTNKPTENV